MSDELVNEEPVSEEPALHAIETEPMIEAGINCGFYFVVMLVAVVLDRVFPNSALTYFLVLLPYLMVLGFILVRRGMWRPRFPIGDVVSALTQLILVWAVMAIVAFAFAYNNGLFRPMSTVSKWNHVGTILEAPLAQEFVFRAALLTSLSKLRVGTMRVFYVNVGAIIGAIVFSVVHAIIFLAAGVGFGDVIFATVTVLIMGLALGEIYVRTQNVWYGVIVHTLFNFSMWG